MSELHKASELAAVNQGHLTQEVSDLKATNTELLGMKELLETAQDCKHVYIGHLAFLLAPHLDFLPAEVAKEVWDLPEDFGFVVIPKQYIPPVEEAIKDQVDKEAIIVP